ncbi:hypothetical protein SAMN02799631_03599 [Methylobacterium sp. 174MFSha1.1]|uniref:hypothetical protein n=1 Tax=Methylobacterium sp. 174MFSha1.1 TaxID=1502749 RepID=UPI0008E74F38|nr:hypothetical protein [Methylobacterium sp. 174MFSha1.1]SFU97951.1 hypothetical protein SAMN02799631_03599 [Methylobacterium sp. 174MFSha1.1]
MILAEPRPAAVAARDILLIGHSHTQCIVAALQARAAPVGWGMIGLPSGGSPVVATEDGIRLDPAIEADLRRRIGPGTLCISTIAGNAHNVLALMATEPPFDFHMPGETGPLLPGAEPIPYATIRLSVRQILHEGDLSMLYAAQAAVPELRFHIESPPPLRDEALIRARMDPYFLERHPAARVADAGLRLKMWRLHSTLFAEACEALGLIFVPAPKAAMDPDGFLRPELAHPTSSTHANEAYGALVADQIERLAR